jgi:hypothetical protein
MDFLVQHKLLNIYKYNLLKLRILDFKTSRADHYIQNTSVNIVDIALKCFCVLFFIKPFHDNYREIFFLGRII